MAVKESSASKIKFKGVDALFGLSEEQECVREIPLDELDTFKNHPFKVFRDDKMEEMILNGKFLQQNGENTYDIHVKLLRHVTELVYQTELIV